MEDPCEHLRKKAATALQELKQASDAMAQYSVIEPYEADSKPETTTTYLKQMQQAFERERLAWEAYYEINLKLLDCIRDSYRQLSNRPDN
jgi:rubrerythrin